MVSFASDYIAGAHPDILKRLTDTNMEALPGYGTDAHCDRAKELIRRAICGTGMSSGAYSDTADSAGADAYLGSNSEGGGIDVELIAGGTQTNQVVISTMLHDWEGVLAAETGHIATHEAGAIEYSGHKVIGLPQHHGKIKASSVDEYISSFYADVNHEHEVYPGMVYISYPTEYGTLYTKEELADIHSVCGKYHIPLYIDGARLAYGLASSACDLTLPEFASLCDVFYIGGTKCGALCGEAIVFTHGNRPAHFMNAVKKRGALLAKGRLLGVQFETLFSHYDDQCSDWGQSLLGASDDQCSCSDWGQSLLGASDDPEQARICTEDIALEDTLYYQVGRHGIEMAEKLEKILRDKGCRFFLESPTNQKFIVMKDEKLEKLKGKIDYSFWEKPDADHTVIRLATSWSTTDEDLAALAEIL